MDINEYLLNLIEMIVLGIDEKKDDVSDKNSSADSSKQQKQCDDFRDRIKDNFFGEQIIINKFVDKFSGSERIHSE
jgi:hypothetical protein